MVQIAFLLWALFFIIMGFSMMPGYMTLVMIISFIGGLIDATNKNKKEKEKREREREKERQRRIAKSKNLHNNFDPVY